MICRGHSQAGSWYQLTMATVSGLTAAPASSQYLAVVLMRNLQGRKRSGFPWEKFVEALGPHRYQHATASFVSDTWVGDKLQYCTVIQSAAEALGRVGYDRGGVKWTGPDSPDCPWSLTAALLFPIF